MLKNIMLIALAGLLAAGFGCSGGKDDKGQVRKRAVPVVAAKVRALELPAKLSVVGNVEAYATAALKAQVGGMVSRQYVKDGQEVAKNDLLFQIDPRPFEAALKEAKGRLEHDVALLEKAENDHGRYTGLKKQDVISQEQFEQTMSLAQSLRGTIKQDEAQLEQARLQLEYASIRAPFSGRVGAVLINEGNIIKANDDRNLLTLNQIQPIYVSFAAPEQYLPGILERRKSGKLEIAAQVGPDDSPAEQGELDSLDNAVDKTTGTIRLKGIFKNESKRLWPGQFAKVTLNLSAPRKELMVPSQAVQAGLNSNYVYLVKPDMTVEMREVELGAVEGGETAIARGLEAGETVVVDGQLRLTSGSLVEFKEQAAEPGVKK